MGDIAAIHYVTYTLFVCWMLPHARQTSQDTIAARRVDLLAFADCTRHPIRNRVIVLLSAKAGLRAGEIANLTWDMVVDAGGQIGTVIELRDHAAKKGGGRLIPMHPDLADALSGWRQTSAGSGHVVRSERGGPMTALSIVVWFNRAYRVPRPGRVLIAFRPPDIHHPGGPARPRGRWVTARRSTVGRASVDPNNPAIHRRRYRRPAQARLDDLNGDRAPDEPCGLLAAWNRNPVPIPIWPTRSRWFIPSVASLGPHRISTIFAPICEVVVSFAPSETTTPLPCLTG